MSKTLMVIFVICGIYLMMGCTPFQNIMLLGETETGLLPAGQKLVTAGWKGQDLWILTRPLHEGETLETYEFRPLASMGQHPTEGKMVLKEVR